MKDDSVEMEGEGMRSQLLGRELSSSSGSSIVIVLCEVY